MRREVIIGRRTVPQSNVESHQWSVLSGGLWKCSPVIRQTSLKSSRISGDHFASLCTSLINFAQWFAKFSANDLQDRCISWHVSPSIYNIRGAKSRDTYPRQYTTYEGPSLATRIPVNIQHTRGQVSWHVSPSIYNIRGAKSRDTYPHQYTTYEGPSLATRIPVNIQHTMGQVSQHVSPSTYNIRGAKSCDTCPHQYTTYEGPSIATRIPVNIQHTRGQVSQSLLHTIVTTTHSVCRIAQVCNQILHRYTILGEHISYFGCNCFCVSFNQAYRIVILKHRLAQCPVKIHYYYTEHFEQVLEVHSSIFKLKGVVIRAATIREW